MMFILMQNFVCASDLYTFIPLIDGRNLKGDYCTLPLSINLSDVVKDKVRDPDAQIPEDYFLKGWRIDICSEASLKSFLALNQLACRLNYHALHFFVNALYDAKLGNVEIDGMKKRQDRFILFRNLETCKDSINTLCSQDSQSPTQAQKEKVIRRVNSLVHVHRVMNALLILKGREESDYNFVAKKIVDILFFCFGRDAKATSELLGLDGVGLGINAPPFNYNIKGLLEDNVPSLENSAVQAYIVHSLDDDRLAITAYLFPKSSNSEESQTSQESQFREFCDYLLAVYGDGNYPSFALSSGDLRARMKKIRPLYEGCLDYPDDSLGREDDDSLSSTPLGIEEDASDTSKEHDEGKSVNTSFLSVRSVSVASSDGSAVSSDILNEEGDASKQPLLSAEHHQQVRHRLNTKPSGVSETHAHKQKASNVGQDILNVGKDILYKTAQDHLAQNQHEEGLMLMDKAVRSVGRDHPMRNVFLKNLFDYHQKVHKNAEPSFSAAYIAWLEEVATHYQHHKVWRYIGRLFDGRRFEDLTNKEKAICAYKEAILRRDESGLSHFYLGRVQINTVDMQLEGLGHLETAIQKGIRAAQYEKALFLLPRSAKRMEQLKNDIEHIKNVEQRVEQRSENKDQKFKDIAKNVQDEMEKIKEGMTLLRDAADQNDDYAKDMFCLHAGLYMKTQETFKECMVLLTNLLALKEVKEEKQGKQEIEPLRERLASTSESIAIRENVLFIGGGYTLPLDWLRGSSAYFKELSHDTTTDIAAQIHQKGVYIAFFAANPKQTMGRYPLAFAFPNSGTTPWNDFQAYLKNNRALFPNITAADIYNLYLVIGCAH